MTDKLIEAFLEMMMAERGASKNTTDAYRRDLEEFARLAKKQKSDLQYADNEHIRDHLRTLHQAGLSPRTTARKLSSLKQFYAFLFSEGTRKDNPTLNIDAPKQGKSLPKYLSEDEVDHLLATAHEDESPEGIRLSALLELLYASGLRVSELVTLPMAAVRKLQNDVTQKYLIVKGKGNKERLVPLNDSAIKALLAYLSLRTHFMAHAKNRYVFASRGKEGYLTRQRMGQLLKALALKANLDPIKVSPHVLRHSFASHLVHHGADLRVVQELLGHADISTTQIYTHVLNERMKSLVFDKHPLARIYENA